MVILEVLKTLIVLIPPLVGMICFLFAFFKARKAKHGAKTEADRANAQNDMQNAVIGFIKSAEEMYAGFDSLMKAKGCSNGIVKKKSVMADLQTYALSKGYEYDAEYWSAKIDELVEFTLKVNARD